MKKDYAEKYDNTNNRLWLMKELLAKHFGISLSHARKVQGIRVHGSAGQLPKVQLLTVGWVNYGANSRISADWDDVYGDFAFHTAASPLIKRFKRLKALEVAYRARDIRQRYNVE